MAWAWRWATTTTTAIPTSTSPLRIRFPLPQQRRRRRSPRSPRRPVSVILAGAPAPPSSTTTATASLDLFVANYVTSPWPATSDASLRLGLARLLLRRRCTGPSRTRLFQNEGGGRFRDVTEAAGITGPRAGPRGGGGRLRRRWLGRPVRGQRRRGQPALDEPPRRHLRGPRPPGSGAAYNAEGPARGEHGCRPRRTSTTTATKTCS